MTTSKSIVRELYSLITSDRCQHEQNDTETDENTNSHLDPENIVEQPAKIECVVGHRDCGVECGGAIVVELWKIDVELDDNKTTLLPVFLKNAIRSHQHFSQLTSWLSSGSIPSEVACFYRSSSNNAIQATDDQANVEFHRFPSCKINQTQLLNVSVQFLKRQSIPIPQRPCLRLSPLIMDQWPLTSPLSSPNDSGVYVDVDLSSLRLKHKHESDECLSPDGPAPKFPAIEDVERLRPVDRLQKTEKEEDERKQQQSERSLIRRGRFRTRSGESVLFNKVTSLPLSSSPTPLGRQRNVSTGEKVNKTCVLPTRCTSLLGSFEESALKGRLEPVQILEGFTLQIVASGSFCCPHTTLPVKVFVFDLNDNEPVPCLGTCSLLSSGRKGYRIPKQGTLQATLFNPQGTVLKVFLSMYDVSDMPASSQTFIRQRYALKSIDDNNSRLQHLLHFRLLTDRRGRLFLHTDIRILFSQDSSLDGINLEVKNNAVVDSGRYRLMSETETPSHPRYSPKK